MMAVCEVEVWEREERVVRRLAGDGPRSAGREAVRALILGMVEGVDWKRDGRRRLVVSQSGVEKLERNMGLIHHTSVRVNDEPLRGTGTEGTEKMGRFMDPARLLEWPGMRPGRVRTVYVVRGAGLPNRRVVECVFGLWTPGSGMPGAGQRVRVRVKDNGLFVPRMAILAEPMEEGDMWRFAGNPGRPELGARYPRGRGRW